MTDQLPLERIIHIAAFRAALREFLHRNERIADKWGLTPQRYLLLLMIEGAPDGSRRLSFTELAQRLQLSRNTVTELCARAEEAGLVDREPAEHDARVVYLKLTAEGHRCLYGAAADNEAERNSPRQAPPATTRAPRMSARALVSRRVGGARSPCH